MFGIDDDLENFFRFGATLALFSSVVSSWSMMIFPSHTNIMIFFIQDKAFTFWVGKDAMELAVSWITNLIDFFGPI